MAAACFLILKMAAIICTCVLKKDEMTKAKIMRAGMKIMISNRIKSRAEKFISYKRSSD
jgi:hypothetical protein